MFHLSRFWVGTGNRGWICQVVNGMCVGGGEGLQRSGNPRGVEDPEDGGKGHWPRIKPDGHSAGVKRSEVGVMASGMWRSLFLFD